MTDEGSAPPVPPPASELTPVPETPPVEPAPAPTPEPAPVVSQETVQEISAPIREDSPSNGAGEIAEAVKDSIMQEVPQPETAREPSPAPPSAPTPQSTSSQPVQQPKTSSKNRMLAVVRQRKADRLEKIMMLAREKGSITNTDVQLLLKVSDATATNYLRELVKIGRLKRSGSKFHARYEPVGG